MSLKKFTIIKLVVVVALAASISASVARNNYIFPILAAALAALLLFYMKRKVKEVIADERDYEIGGNAARWAMGIYSWLATIGMFILYANQGRNPFYQTIAVTLAYSVCFLLIAYSLIFRYYQKIKFINKKTIFITAGIAFLIAFTIAGIRLFSGEDDWICKNGEWIKHGQPSFPAPTMECRK